MRLKAILFNFGMAAITLTSHSYVFGKEITDSRSSIQLKILNSFCENPVSREEFKGALKATILPYIGTTTRAVSFYSYGTRSPEGKFGLNEVINLPSKDGSFTGPVDLHPKEMNGADIGDQYLKSMAYSATHASDQVWEFGRGLYSATEPLASVGYSGGNQGFLIKINVPEKSNFLDLRLDHKEVPISGDTARILGCFILQKDPSFFENDNYAYQRLIKNISEPNSVFDLAEYGKHSVSREVMADVFAEDALVFTAAGYGAYNYGECELNPAMDSMTMAVFQNSGSLAGVSTEIYVPALESNPSGIKKRSYKNLREYFSEFSCEASEQKGFIVRLCDPTFHTELDEFNRYQNAFQNVLGNAKSQSQSRRARITKALFGCNKNESLEYSPPTKIQSQAN